MARRSRKTTNPKFCSGRLFYIKIFLLCGGGKSYDIWPYSGEELWHVLLPGTATVEEIGKAILDMFDKLENGRKGIVSLKQEPASFTCCEFKSAIQTKNRADESLLCLCKCWSE